MSEQIRRFDERDIPGVIRLKDAAGWNQTEMDLQRVLRLSPEGCFCIELDGEVVASATLVCYGYDLAWIGMVLTLPEFRGRGYASRLTRRCIDLAEERGVEWIKLDATDMGAPVYRKLGFEDERPIERWHRPAAASGRAAVGEGRLGLALDAEVFGARRTSLLLDLAVDGCASIEGRGYAMGRRGSKASYFGPCVARDEEAATQLLRWHLERHGAQGAYWDLFPKNEAAARIADEHGFVRARRLVRMARRGAGDAPPLQVDHQRTYAIAGFEYG